MQTQQIKRVLVTRNGKIVGIVSRADIVQALARRPSAEEPMDSDDDIIRFKVMETLMNIPATTPWLTTVEVLSGVVELNGTIQDEIALKTSRVAIEQIAYVVRVNDHRSILQPY